MSNCKLIFPPEPNCSGKIVERFFNNYSVACCEKHFITFKQIRWLAECGVPTELLKNSTVAERALWIRQIEETVNDNT